MTISVLVVDDQPLFCSGMRLLIDAQPDLQYAGAAHSGAVAIEEVMRIRPDVVLMDLRMPDGNGLVATERISREAPRSRVIVLTTFRDQGIVQRALAGGAAGFITKDATPGELLNAIRTAAAGKPVRTSTSNHLMLDDPLFASAPNTAAIGALTPREKQIFLHVARGLTNAQIAEASSISENTVRNHVSAVLQKLHLDNRTQMAAFAHREGLLPAPFRLPARQVNS